MSTTFVIFIYGAAIHVYFIAAFRMPTNLSSNRTYKAFQQKHLTGFSNPLLDPLADLANNQLIDNFDQIDKPYECGTRRIEFNINRRVGRVIGGEVTPYGAFPWQAEIQMFNYDKKKFEHQCGGALIADRIALTAAHCLQVSQTEYLRLVLGQHVLHEPDLFEHGYRIDEILLHPEYRKNGPYSNDIGLLRVRTPHALGIPFNTYVRTICLPEVGNTPRPGTWCTVSGWGTHESWLAKYLTVFNKTIAPPLVRNKQNIDGVLRAASVPILDLNTCRKDSINGGRAQKVLDSMLCAGFLNGGVDACGGDSGGPLACEIEGKFYLNGIVSWGDGCAKKNRPGVYTRIDIFADWIRNSIKKLQ